MQSGYIDILSNVNQLPKSVKYTRFSSIGEVTHAVNSVWLSKTAEFDKLEHFVLDETLMERNNSTPGTCFNQSKALFTAIVKRETWALKSKIN